MRGAEVARPDGSVRASTAAVGHPMVQVSIALGSNEGDRLARLQEALVGLAHVLTLEAVSSVYESAPVGLVAQEDFLNAVAVGRTELPSGELLAVMLGIEDSAGRIRRQANGPRPLDLDLLFYGDRVICEPDLVVPHPRWSERSFVLAPLAEVAPDAVDPESGRPVTELWSETRRELPPVTLVGRLTLPASGTGLFGP